MNCGGYGGLIEGLRKPRKYSELNVFWPNRYEWTFTATPTCSMTQIRSDIGVAFSSHLWSRAVGFHRSGNTTMKCARNQQRRTPARNLVRTSSSSSVSSKKTKNALILSSQFAMFRSRDVDISLGMSKSARNMSTLCSLLCDPDQTITCCASPRRPDVMSLR